MKQPTVDLKKAERRVKAMEDDRASFLPVWRDLTSYFLVHRGRYTLGDINRGQRRDTKIYNNAPLLARRVLSAGLMSGITSPARQWFRLTTGSASTDEDHGARRWLFDVSQIMYQVYALTNLYNSLQTFYNEICTFGTAAMSVYEDDESHLRFETHTAGQYAVGMGRFGRVESFCTRQDRQVVEIVKEYGEENCPQSVKNMWQKGQENATRTVVTLTEPNDDRDSTSPFSWNKKYRSITWIVGEKEPLRVSGYDTFPHLVARWDIAPGDIYGTSCPAMTALGDAKALQLAEKDVLTLMNRMADPPGLADANLRQVIGDRGPQPGRTYYTDDVNRAYRSLVDNNVSLSNVEAQVQRYESRVSQSFYVDLFRMMVNSDRREMTAREVAERHEEKLLQIGPVLERMHNELLDGLVDRSFHILQRREIFPDPPEALAGRDLRVDYLSVMAQAQKISSVQGLERLAGFIAEISQLDPDVAKSLDTYAAVVRFAEATGTDPDVLRSLAAVQQMAQQAQQQEQLQQGIAAAEPLTKAAKNASQADLSGQNALAALMRQAGSGL